MRSTPRLTDWLHRLETQLDLDRLIQGCCQALMELTGAERCSIMVLDRDGAEALSVRWAVGVRARPPTGRERVRFRVGEGLCGWVARSQRPYCSFNVAADPRFVPYHAPRHGFRPVKAICCLPLVVKGQTVGVANLSTFSPTRKFRWVRRRSAQQFLDRLSGVIAQAMRLRDAETTSHRWTRLAKATSDAVAQVSHEVRTPLTVITEAAQQLLDRYGGVLSPQQQQLAQLIKAQADRMLKLVTELLDLARIGAGRLALARQPLDLAEVIQEVRSRYEPLVAPRRLRVQLEPAPAVYGDRSRLIQVAENLVTNAVKFTPPTGTITLALRARRHSVELGVSDTGRGIPKRDQQRLFEKFFQSAVPATLNVRGTGLGLVIVKEVVTLHGGMIRVASAPGRGTTFTVSLPIYSPAFALAEEFCVMREQAARDGATLVCQVFRAEPGTSVEWPQLIELLRQHVSRRDRVLLHADGGLVVLLAVSDPEGAPAVRRRLEEVLGGHPALIPPSAVHGGWALVPQEATELPAALRLAETRARGSRAPGGARGQLVSAGRH